MSESSNVPDVHQFDNLPKYRAMVIAIDIALAVDEVKSIRDEAERLEMYARQAKNRASQLQACQVKIWAERRAGELLLNLKRGRPSKNKKGSSEEPFPVTKTLSELGISKKQAFTWQKLAEIPIDQFKKLLNRIDLSTQGLLKEYEATVSVEMKPSEQVEGTSDADDFADEALADKIDEIISPFEWAENLAHKENVRNHAGPPKEPPLLTAAMALTKLSKALAAANTATINLYIVAENVKGIWNEIDGNPGNKLLLSKCMVSFNQIAGLLREMMGDKNINPIIIDFGDREKPE